MTKTRAATHSGHCQCCGRLQKLPADLLSKHGYTVDGGYFCGICRGAGELPYEVSCDLIKGFIESAKMHLNILEMTQADLRKSAREPKAWIHEYVPASWKRRVSSYVWRDVEVFMKTHCIDDHEYATFYYIGKNIHGQQAEIKIDLCGSYTDVLAVCSELNNKKAEWMQNDINQMQRYIIWQQRRVDEWKLRPLLPVEHKDKEGFELIR